MTILISKLTSEYRGGPHGEKTTSHDGEKKQQQEASTDRRPEVGTTTERSEVPAGVKDETAIWHRQSQSSNEDIAQCNAKSDGGHGMTDGTSNLPKTGGQVARVAGQLFNDTRITNVLMLCLVLIGMGGAESAQSALCSL